MQCRASCAQLSRVRSTVVVPLSLTLRGRVAWTSSRRHTVCAAYKLERAGENTIVLHGPHDAPPVAYVVGVQHADQGTVAVTQQVERALRQLQRQQQVENLLVLLDPALTAAPAPAATGGVSESNNAGIHSAAHARLQQQLVELVSEYGGQLQLLTQQQRQQDSALDGTTPAAVAQDQVAASKAEGSSSSSSTVSSLLLSGLGQAGRAASAAATTAAAAVIDFVEGAAAVTSAAIIAFEQRGVDVAADVPDMSLRPSACRDWRKSPSDSQFAWQAALIFCVLLIQLEKAGFDFVITNDDEDESDSSTMSLAGSDSDSDDDEDDVFANCNEAFTSEEDLLLRNLCEEKGVPNGSVVHVIRGSDGEIRGVHVIRSGWSGYDGVDEEIPDQTMRFADEIRSMTSEDHSQFFQNFLQQQIKSGEIQISVGEATPYLYEKGFVSASSKENGQPEAAADGVIDITNASSKDAASDSEDDDGDGDDGFKALGMFVTDDGQVVLLGIDDQGEIQVKKQQQNDRQDSSSSSRKERSGAGYSTESHDSNAKLTLDSFLQAGQLPLAGDSNKSSNTGNSEVCSEDSSSGTTSSSSSSSKEHGSTSDNAGETTAGAASDLDESDDEADDCAPRALSSSDSINLFKKEFRHRVNVAHDSSKAAKDSSSSSSSSSQQGQQGEDGGGGDGEANQDVESTDDDRWVLQSDDPEMLAAMLQLERSWNSGTANREASSSESSSSSAGAAEQVNTSIKQSTTGSSSSPSSAAAADDPLPELLPKPIRPQQQEDSSTDSHSSSRSSSDQGGLTSEEAAEVQAMMEERSAAAAAAAESSSDGEQLQAKRSRRKQQQQNGAGAAADASSNEQAAKSSILSDNEIDGADVVEAFRDFEQKLEAEGIDLNTDDKIRLFAELFGEDSDSDDDDDDEDDEADTEQADSSDDKSASTAVSDKDSDTNSSSSSDSIAAGGLVRSSRAKAASSSSSRSSGPSAGAPSGPGWDQLSRLIPSDQLSKLPDLLKSGNVRLSGLNPLEVSMLISGLARLQKGEVLDSQEIVVLMRVINEAEITPEGQEPDPDAALKRRNRALRKQQQQARQGPHRTAAGRAGTLGYGVNIKDRAYVQDTRSVRVPKAASRSRSEKVKQAIRQLRQRRQQQEMQLMQRRALQFARLQLQSNMEAELEDSVIVSNRGKREEGGSEAQGSSEAAGLITDSSKGSTNSKGSGWRGGLKRLRAAFSQSTGGIEPQQQQQQQQGVSAVSTIGTAEAALQKQQQLQAKGSQLVQQLQAAAGQADGNAAGGRVVVAVVGSDLLQYVEEQWGQTAGS